MPLLRTPDHRSLDVRVAGPDGGAPLLVHHGTPGSVVPVRDGEGHLSVALGHVDPMLDELVSTL